MRKTRLFKKRILALALSVSMIFASTDTYVAMAAEAENLDVVEDNDYQTDETEAASAVSNEESDIADDVDDAGEDDSAGDPDITTKEDETDSSEVDDADAADDAETDEVDTDEADAIDEEDTEVLEADEPAQAVDADGFTVDAAGKLTAYSGDGGDITIPDGVVTIGSKVFQNNTTITGVTFSSDVKTIESYAFAGCTKLGTVVLNEGLVTIDSYAFNGAVLGTKYDTGRIECGSITIPGTVQSIGTSAFSGCSYLGEITFANGENDILSISSTSASFSAFGGCTSLKKVTLPKRLKTIPSQAFNRCSALEEVVFGENLETIEGWAFYYCTSLKEIDLPDTVKTIGDSAFSDCSSLSRVDLKEGLLTIGKTAFLNAAFGEVLGTGVVNKYSLIIPSTVQSIGAGAFKGCSYLEEVTFADGINDVLDISSTSANYTFGGCTSLKKVTLPKRLKVIPYHAFSGCSALEEVLFGENIETIEEGAFRGCSSLRGADLKEGLVTIGKSAFEEVAFGEVSDTGEVNKYKLIIPSTVQSIGGGAFSGSKYLEEVTFADGETVVLDITSYITSKAFGDCTSLKKVTLPKRLKTLPDYIFDGCTALEEVVFVEGLETIGNNAFSGCDSLKEVDLPDTVKTIGTFAFSSCSSLSRIDLKEGLVTIGDKAFFETAFGEVLSTGAVNKYSLTIPSTVQSIGYQAFKECKYLENVIFENGETVVLNISTDSTYGCFYRCSSLKTVILPERIKQLDKYTFNSCENLEMLYIPEAVTTIAERAIYNCPKLTIYGITGSTAEKYAKDNGIPFKSSQELGTTVTGVSLNITQITRFNEDAIGETVKLTATVTPVTAKNKTVTYTSSNTAVATVDDKGLVKLTGFGNANITVTTEDGGKKASCRVTIIDPFSDDDEVDDSVFNTDERADLREDAGGEIANIKAKTYDGLAYKPTVKVTVIENGKKKTLTEGIDYRVEYKNNVAAGTDGKVIVWGSGKYKGSLEKNLEIKPKSIKKLKIIAGSMAVGDTVFGVPVYVYDGSTLLKENSDYTLTGTENLTAGTNAGKSVKVTINAVEGKSNYTGTTTAKIAVYNVSDVSKIINPEDITLSASTNVATDENQDLQIPYTGKALKPAVTVKKDGIPLANKNYKVQYQNNTNAGTAYVIITGKGEYAGKVVKTFKITSSAESFEITNKDKIKAKTYNGKFQKPSVTVKAGKKKLKKNKDYAITYKNNLHAGTAIIVIKGIGNYEGGFDIATFTINPQKISKVSVKGTQNDGLTVTYSKRLLKEDVDYTLEYDEASKTKSKIKVTIKAVETDFTGSVTKSVKLQ